MTSSSDAATRLAEIDALQDEVLRQLADLEQRCQTVLASCQAVPGVKIALGLPPYASSSNRPQKRKAA